MKKISKFMILAVSIVLLSTQVNATVVDGECDDTIFKPGKKIHVHYHNNKFGYSLSCEKIGKNKNWWIPSHQGNSCADKRVDGCSLSWTDILFTKRDKRLMTPSCNAHDLCYSTYGFSKESCDKEFKKNLKATKKKFNGGYSVDAIMAGVYEYGQDGYDDGQSWGDNNDCPGITKEEAEELAADAVKKTNEMVKEAMKRKLDQ